MPDLKETVTIPRKLLPIIYVIDTSGSMEGYKISSVNEAIRETVDVLREISEENPSAELKIGILTFSSNAEWITQDGFKFLEDYYWNDLQAGGLTDFGSALCELDKKLSRNGFLDDPIGYKIPVIIFLSDGEPTDDNWESVLVKTEANNKWFQMATKIAIAVENANEEVLAKIVGNRNSVIHIDDMGTLKKLITVVSVVASRVGSESRTNGGSQNEVIAAIKSQLDDTVKRVIPISSDDITYTDTDSFPTWNEDSDDVWGSGNWE